MPTAKIKTPDGRIITLQVPQGASEQDILNYIKSQDLSKTTSPQKPVQKNIIDEISDSASNSANPLMTMLGSAENVASLAASGLLEPVAGLAGLGAEGLQALGVDAPSGADVVRSVQDFAYQPKTQEGQRIQQGVGKSLQKAGEMIKENITEPLGINDLGQKTLESTGSPLAATAVETTIASLPELLPTGYFGGKLLKRSRQAKKIIADQIKAGNPNVDTVTKILNDRGDIVTNKTAKRALKTIKKDIGSEKATQLVSVTENMSDASKSQVNKMLDVIEKGRKEPIFAQTNRPSDILGDAVANRAKAIARVNENAARNIGEIASKSLKGKVVDINNPVRGFFNDLQDIGVKIGKDPNSPTKIKLDFSESQFVGGGAEKIERLANFVKNGQVDGFQGHRIKQFARELVDFGKGTDSAVSARSQNIIKKLASGINENLSSVSPEYRKANQRFAKTIELKEGFDKLAGKDIDIFSDISNKALGGKARRLVSNAESRVQIEQLINQADDVLNNDFRIRFKDDIPSLNHTVTQLENLFKIEPPGSFQGRIQRAGSNIAQGLNPKAQATEMLTDKLFSLSQPDFDKKMKAMRALTKVKGK